MTGLLDFLSLRDMVDGGGAGRAGQTFEGGALSPILNSLGIRPLGFRDRLATARPMARPMDTAPAPRPVAPQAAPSDPYSSPIETQPLIGGMTLADILEAIQRGGPQGLPGLMDLARAQGAQSQDRAAAEFGTYGPDLFGAAPAARMDASRMAAASQAVPFGAAPGAVDRAANRTQVDTIRRNLESVGVRVPEGVIGSLMPYLSRMPRISQQADFVRRYMAMNNMAPQIPWASQYATAYGAR